MNIPFTAGDELEADDLSNAILNGGLHATTTGSSNAYILALTNPTLTALSDGLEVNFKANFSNTGASTINVNSIGAKSIKNLQGNDLVANDIRSGQEIKLKYNGTYFQLVSPSGNAPVGVSFIYRGTAPNPSSPFAGTVQTIAHGLGVAPTEVQITAFGITFSGVINSAGEWNGSGTKTIATINGGSSGYVPSTTSDTTNIIFMIPSNTGAKSVAVITVDATNIYLTWSHDGTWGTAGTVNYLIKAKA